MKYLAIDTSAVASAALISAAAGHADAHVAAEFATEDTRSHAEVLVPGVEHLFTDAVRQGPELDGILVGVGPGPFTGLRSGIAVARTLAFTWQVPLFGVMSLDAVAWDVLASGQTPETDWIVATDARRKEVYWARYSSTAALLDGPHVGAAETLPPIPVFGKGAGLYQDTLQAAGSTVAEAFTTVQPLAASLGLFAMRQLASGMELLDSSPLYLRGSDAQVPGPRKRAL